MKYLGWALLVLSLIFGLQTSDGKKIKNSFTIPKSKTIKAKEETIKGIKIELSDSLQNFQSESEVQMSDFRGINFAGYDKEPNSAVESFVLVNPTPSAILGFEVKIDYLDMQDRMLHSRNYKTACFIPGGETRRFDIKSWDSQNTYYYYLGNAPKRVATPFKVTFTPLAVWVEP